MIKPTVGRIVWYHPALEEGDGVLEKTQAAVVCHVHSDFIVNLAVFDENGKASAKTSVHLVQESNEPRPNFGYAEWMPCQQGSAEANHFAPVQ